MRLALFYLSVLFLLVSCSLAPPYQRPSIDIPTHYKETGKWLEANPKASNTTPSDWWKMYHDATLNQLEEQVTSSNQSLKAALARYEESRATTAAASAGYYPEVTATANPQRLSNSGNVANRTTISTYNDILLGSNVSYEVDLWGRIKNLVAAAKDRERASAADLAAMDLSLHAELASDYFSLRGVEASQSILDQTVEVYKKALYLNRMRHNGGATPIADVDQAETQLKTAQTLAADARLKRAQLEHAIAVLVGETPSSFSLPITQHHTTVLSPSPSLPSTLLERRPDIAAAELRVEASNADIGQARAAFYPDISLMGSIGFESQTLANLLRLPSLFWSIGPSATQVLFDGGRIQAFLDKAKASYSETVADYRQTVLLALQEVEDKLVAIHRLNQEMRTEADAVHSANQALKQANYRYTGGIITYLEVVETQNIALQAELAQIDIQTRRQMASVQLIKAIGGGWSGLQSS